MSGPFRLPSGGRIDRSAPIEFEFDRRRLTGFAGDTLASALLAAGVRLAGRSFKYHRPRGVFTAGAEEPNALLTVDDDPNRPATTVELTDGLKSRSQNCWPSPGLDLMAINRLLAPVFGAGFYYKTFIWPPRGWLFYERFIRQAAGLGESPREADAGRYDEVSERCDVLVVGGGVAGLSAALEESEKGHRVVLAEADFAFGGRAIGRAAADNRQAADVWIAAAVDALAARPNVTLLSRTRAIGAFEGGFYLLAERRPGPVRERLWRLCADRLVVAAGAVEQPLVFPGNDLPGVMLAGASATYLNRFAVAAGRRAVVYANNDEALELAFALADAGVEVAAVVDPRPPSEALADRCAGQGIEYLPRATMTGARGGRRLEGVEIAGGRRIACDHLAVSGGYSPSTQLFTQAGGRLEFSPEAGAYMPVSSTAAKVVGRASETRPAAVIPAVGLSKTAFVDMQNDVTVADIVQAAAEGYDSAELLKRYTTLGMGADQGRTSQLAGWRILGEATGGPAAPTAPIRARPPIFPVSLGALAAGNVGAALRPQRRTPLDSWQVEAGAEFMPAGLWRRARYYPRAGDNLEAASNRETLAVRQGVGIADVSTLGKFEICGPDAAEFLDRVYVNRWSTAPLMRARYGLMLREDGLVFDDGTCIRLEPDRFFMTTTTVHAEAVLAHLERHLQVVWPNLRVRVAPMTESWAAIALSGPSSRAVLAAASRGLDLSKQAFPRQAAGVAAIGSVAVRIVRMSFSGELGYEIYTPRTAGLKVWRALLEAGEAFGIAPYGLEALSTLRIEVGHLGDGELDGRTTLADLRMEKMLARKDCIGARMAMRPALADPARPVLVGLGPADGRTLIPVGAHLLERSEAIGGRVSSSAFSARLGRPVALGLLRNGRGRIGDRLIASSPVHGRRIDVVVCPSEHIPASDRSIDD